MPASTHSRVRPALGQGYRGIGNEPRGAVLRLGGPRKRLICNQQVILGSD